MILRTDPCRFFLVNYQPDVHSKQAITEIQKPFRLIREELGGDLVEAVSALDDDASFAEQGHGFGGGVGGEADALSQLGNHEWIAAGELAQEAPPAGIADGGENVVEGNDGRRSGRGVLGIRHGFILSDRVVPRQERSQERCSRRSLEDSRIAESCNRIAEPCDRNADES